MRRALVSKSIPTIAILLGCLGGPPLGASPDIQRQASQEAVATSAGICVNAVLGDSKAAASLHLGRVLWDNQVREPVLISNRGTPDAPQYDFRDCSTGEAKDVTVGNEQVELFPNALVAYFGQKKTGALATYRETLAMSYESRGKATFEFDGSGAMLEARRLDDNHVEVTGTGAVQILPVDTILLVASRKVMRELDPKVWEEAWGNKVEDANILRDILWWELVGSAEVRVHPPADSFPDLARLVDGDSTGPAVPWGPQHAKNLASIFSRDALSLIVVEEPTHIERAEALFAAAEGTNTEVDIGVLEEIWDEDTEERSRLEEASSRGSLLLLVRHFDLAAIMPDRIAGKLRRNYLQSSYSKSTQGPVSSFVKQYVTLTTHQTEALTVANALFQDQARSMKDMLNFLSCLVNVGGDRDARRDVLEYGLGRAGLSEQDLGAIQAMNFNQAFQYLFQGSSLPPGLRVGERSFLRSLSGQDPEAVALLEGIVQHLDSLSLEEPNACGVVLVPDAAMVPISKKSIAEVALHQVPSIPTQVPDEAVAPLSMDPTAEKIRQAKQETRKALEAAIYAKGAKHTERKIRNGHKKLDEANLLLAQATGNPEVLEKALKALEKAKEIFDKAKEISIEKENDVPRMPVF